MVSIKYLKDNSMSFTGHRDIREADYESLRYKIRLVIKTLYKKGICTYYCGMARGFDMLAAEEVIKLKGTYKCLNLVAVVPFRGQCGQWNETDKKRYWNILANVDKSIILSETYYKGCLLRRNDFMLAQSCGIIAYFDGNPKGGTFYTCRRAKKMGMDIINVYANCTRN